MTPQLVLLFRIALSLTFTAALGQHWNQLSSYYSQLQREELLHHCTMHMCLWGEVRAREQRRKSSGT